MQQNENNDANENIEVENKSFFDKVKGFFKKFRDGDIKEIPLEDVPQGIHGCQKVYMSLYQDQSNPIFMGIDGDKVRVSFGDDRTFVLNKEMFTYMSGAFFNLGATILKSEFNDHKPLKSISQTKQVVHSGKLQQPLDEEESKEQEFENLQRQIQGEPKSEAQKLAEDVQGEFDEMDPDERRLEKQAMQKELMGKKEDAISSFEDMLLGDIDKDDPITYDDTYFEKIYQTRGIEALREELATIDESKRQPIMDKIMAGATPQQQKPDNNENS
jgi:hypothetical protein